MNQIILTQKDAWEWIKQHFTRKWTVWIHILAGILCAVMCQWYTIPATTAFIAFAWFEWWQASVEKDAGHLDFWDALFGYFIGLVILLILKLTGVF